MKKLFLLFIVTGLSYTAVAQSVQKIKIADLEKIIQETNTPLIINFWATWCVPCIKELPYFQEEVKKHAKDSLQLLLVSLDMEDTYPKKLKKFIKKQGLVFPVLWLAETDADYFCPKVDKKWSGSIPATIFIHNKYSYRQFFEDQLSQEELQQQINNMLTNAANTL